MTDIPAPAWQPPATAPAPGKRRCGLCAGDLNADADRCDAARYTVYRACPNPDCDTRIHAVALCDACVGGPLPTCCPHCPPDVEVPAPTLPPRNAEATMTDADCWHFRGSCGGPAIFFNLPHKTDPPGA